MIDYPIRLSHVLFTVPVPTVWAPFFIGSGDVLLHPMLFFFISCLWGDIYALPPDIETKNRGRKDGRPYTHEDRCHSLAEIPAAASAPHFQAAAQSRRIKKEPAADAFRIGGGFSLWNIHTSAYLHNRPASPRAVFPHTSGAMPIFFSCVVIPMLHMISAENASRRFFFSLFSLRPF